MSSTATISAGGRLSAKSSSDLGAIADFLQRHDYKLSWIIRDSGGLWERDDLTAEVILALHDLCTTGNPVLDLCADEDATLLLRQLRRRANQAGRGLRNPVRPDQAESGEGWRPGMLGWDQFTGDEGEHPLSLLEALESPQPEPREFDPYHSETAAWNWLLHRFERRTRDIATFLLISTSWCRVRRRRAWHRANAQWQLPHYLLVGDDELAIQPWRKFKLPPTQANDPLQLCLDYWSRPLQPDRGQLWLI